MFKWRKNTREKMAVGVKEGKIPSQKVVEDNDNFHTANMNLYPKRNIITRLTGLINRRMLDEDPIYKAVVDGATQKNEDAKMTQWVEYVSRLPKEKKED